MNRPDACYQIRPLKYLGQLQIPRTTVDTQFNNLKPIVKTEGGNTKAESTIKMQTIPLI